MKKLENKIALVPGETGGVGEAIVKSLLAEGATVIVPSRRQERLDELLEGGVVRLYEGR
jgi:NADP-dependent 3-hydroxy acid dehydrogenase YdfG